MRRDIAVVGGGAASLAFLYAYIRQRFEEAARPASVLVFEKNGIPGPGVAYLSDLDSNLLNTKTAVITPFFDRPGDFMTWLKDEEAIWRARFPDFLPDPEGYAPRPLFGLYLAHRFLWVCRLAASQGVIVEIIPAEVSNILPSGQHFLVTAGVQHFDVTDVVLALGTLPATYQDQSRDDLFFTSPYPLTERCDAIGRSEDVAIIGARLGCIDSVIALLKAGHRGKIAIYSRSGYFPAVRGAQGRFSLAEFPEAVQAIAASGRSLTLRDLLALGMRELQLHGSEIQEPFSLPPPPGDLGAFLRSEISQAVASRPWQGLLYATNAFIDTLWSHLNVADRKLLLTTYMAPFMSYRVSFPVENARILLNHLDSGQIEFYGGPFQVKRGEQGKPHAVDRLGFAKRCFGAVIVATGTPRGVKELDSTLLTNLLKQGIVTADPMGGLKVDRESHRAVDFLGQQKRSVRLIGELTNGTFFFTSALEIIVRQALNCARSMALETSQPEAKRRVS